MKWHFLWLRMLYLTIGSIVANYLLKFTVPDYYTQVFWLFIGFLATTILLSLISLLRYITHLDLWAFKQLRAAGVLLNKDAQYSWAHFFAGFVFIYGACFIVRGLAHTALNNLQLFALYGIIVIGFWHMRNMMFFPQWPLRLVAVHVFFGAVFSIIADAIITVLLRLSMIIF